jgi:S1-C subfamily serine protease
MKNIGKVLLAVLILTGVCLSGVSCMFVGGFGNSADQLTKEDVQQMINNGMNGNITVEGGDNLDITINSDNSDNVIAARALLSTVSIDCKFKTASLYPSGFGSTSKEKNSSGSGVIFRLDKEKGDAYIITNYHVVYYTLANTQNGISNDISVYLYGQESKEYAIPAKYVGGSMSYDLAILKVEGSRVLAKSNAVEVEFANSDDVAVLDKAIAVGNPEDLGISATLGYINVDSEYIAMEGADGSTAIQLRVMRIDTAVNSGNSGGGLFDNKGRLIGIVNAKLKNSENMSYALPANFVRYVADNIIYYCDGKDNEKVMRCYLGITVGAMELYTVYNKDTGKVHKREKVSVASIENGAIADGALRVGDVINSITIDGTKYDVTRMFVVTDSMINARVNSVVVINVTRDGVAKDIEINIAQKSLTQVE